MQPTLTPNSALGQPRRSIRHVPALAGLRAIAAYLVFLHHYNPATPGTFAHRLFAQGYIGVSVFFVLSGFLMYYRYADAYFEQKSWSWRAYLQNRFARIFPLYVLLLLVTVGVNTQMGRPMSLALLGLNLTLLKGFFEDYIFSGIAQSWSLTVEVCFYLAAPLLFVALRRWGALPLTALLITIGLLIWRIVSLFNGHEKSGEGLVDSFSFVLFYTFFGRSFEFITGMWLARRWQQNRLFRSRFATGSGLLVMSSCVLWQTSITTLTHKPTALLWSEFIVYNCALPLGICLLFSGLLNSKSIVHQLLSQPVMQAPGQSSYAFYLIHIGIVANGLQKVGVTNHGLLFGLLVLIAQGLYLTVEKPFQRLLRA